MNTIIGNSAPELYENALNKVPLWVREDNSRNGPVLRVQGPVILELYNPLQRVLFDPVRMANPYFHVMEFIWMMSGDNSTRWISQFNKGFKNYAESNGLHHGAYGHRWREHFGHDQLLGAVDELRRDPESRRVVLSMWDPSSDQGRGVKDVPCNTHIYLDTVDDRLNMTVCNRSNDLFWGMLGSNLVHMTLLQELLATAIGVGVGVYRVFTNNLHVYPGMPRFHELWNQRYSPNLYHHSMPVLEHFPVLNSGMPDALQTFLDECYAFIHEPKEKYESQWLEHVAVPMYHEYMARLDDNDESVDWVTTIADGAWRKACGLWEEWHR